MLNRGLCTHSRAACHSDRAPHSWLLSPWFIYACFSKNVVLGLRRMSGVRTQTGSTHVAQRRVGANGYCIFSWILWTFSIGLNECCYISKWCLTLRTIWFRLLSMLCFRVYNIARLYSRLMLCRCVCQQVKFKYCQDLFYSVGYCGFLFADVSDRYQATLGSVCVCLCKQ